MAGHSRTVALVGYQFGVNDFTGDDNTVIPNPDRQAADVPLERRAQQPFAYVYVGFDHSFNPQLDASLRVGAQFTEYNNLPGAETIISALTPMPMSPTG